MKYYIIDSPNYDQRYNKELEIIFEKFNIKIYFIISFFQK